MSQDLTSENQVGHTLESQLEEHLKKPVDSVIQSYIDELLGAVSSECIEAVLFYGSYKSRTIQNQDAGQSYIDFYVVLRDGKEEEFYRGLVQKRRHGYSEFKMQLSTLKAVAFHHILPPTMYDFTHRDANGRMVHGAKFCVISRQDLERDLSIFASDHHQRARFSQPMVLAYPRENSTYKLCAEWLARAHRNTFEFVKTRLSSTFDVESFLRQFLFMSYTAEVRPEIEGKIDSILKNESKTLLPLYETVLLEKIESGELQQPKRGFFQIQGQIWSWKDRVIYSIFRLKTKSREFFRWWKNMLTFDNWIDYICDKVERNIGYRIKVSSFERRFWFLAVWWKLVEFLIAKNRRRRELSRI